MGPSYEGHRGNRSGFGFRSHGRSAGSRFGHGRYGGHPYYHSYRHFLGGYDYAFFYPLATAFAYVPYGFYADYTTVYVTQRATVRDGYGGDTSRAVAEIPNAGENPLPAIDPEPAAGSPVTERYLREASEAFRRSEYLEAALKFRLGALAVPESAAPLFGLGLALMALGDDEYAAAVIRRAVTRNPALLSEAGDIVGVYASSDEFDRVTRSLELRVETRPADADALFLLGVHRYFSGDPRARESFLALALVDPSDPVARSFRLAVEKRFEAAKDLPEIRRPEEPSGR